ncbi:MAG: hypothetical protein ACI9JN_000263 [Bacteroidia bacterium]|jgi:hypothetical protein
MKHRSTILLFAFFSLVSCSSDFITLNIAQFNIDSEKLANKSLVKVLSFSGMPDYNKNADYYVHMIIVSEEYNDTFNLLTIKPGRILSDEDKVMNYFSENSTIYKSFIATYSANQDRITKVKVNKNFIEDIKNAYPTVIGILGDVSK